ncbi:dehydratase, partial [Methylobacterium radiotolerans]
MPDPALEDFSVGDVIVGEPLTVTRDDIVGFAKDFDFQPFHLDEAAAETTFAGRLIGSGWHTAALGMRLLQQGPFRGRLVARRAGHRRAALARAGPAGDALTLTFRVAGLRD